MLVLPHLDWSAGDAITGTATLSIADTSVPAVWGSGSGVLAFSYDQVDGSHHTGYGQTADCQAHPIGPAAPISHALARSGGFAGEDPDAAFLRSFFLDPQIHLPAGTWDVTALAIFLAEPGCAGPEHQIKATVRIAVAP